MRLFMAITFTGLIFAAIALVIMFLYTIQVVFGPVAVLFTVFIPVFIAVTKLIYESL